MRNLHGTDNAVGVAGPDDERVTGLGGHAVFNVVALCGNVLVAVEEEKLDVVHLRGGVVVGCAQVDTGGAEQVAVPERCRSVPLPRVLLQ